MQNKLTLRLEEGLTGSTEKREEKRPLTPIVKSLVGLLEGSKLDEADYKRYLEEKHL